VRLRDLNVEKHVRANLQREVDAHTQHINLLARTAAKNW
jgi:hypothetical protein